VLALRTRDGIAWPDADAPGADAIAELAAAGLLEVRPFHGSNRLVLTRAGRLLASDVTARVVLSGVGTHYD
jgi:hypothetical protein